MELRIAAPLPPTFATVFAEHAALVWRTMRRLGLREADAEDLAQEVFMVIHRKLPTFEARSKLSTWIYGICVNVAADHHRRAHVRREVPTDDLPDRGVPGGQDAALAAAESRARLDRALETLDDDKRAVFVLYELEEVPMAEIAVVVGAPLQTVYTRLHAARRQLAAVLAPTREDA